MREPKDAALERIARARFRLDGDTAYPDATGTLRLNYGAVQGWTEPDGRKVAPFTFFSGLFERATGAVPFKLAPLWEAAQGQAEPGHDLQRRDQQRHARRQFRIAGDRPRRQVRRRAVRRQYPRFRRLLPLRSGSSTAPWLIAATAIEEGLAKVYGLQRIVDELKEP